jgi:uncharacterized surface protein with fasciclin (FAS1) repeats
VFSCGGVLPMAFNPRSVGEGFDMVRSRWIAVAACSAALGVGVSAVIVSTPVAHAQAPTMAAASGENIIRVATGPGMERVTTLVAAVKAAGLVETLEGPGPFTVFAPTNEAFAALPPGVLDSLLKPENKDKLRAILLYHVHAGDSILAKDCKTMELKSADDGKPLNIKVEGDKVMVNDATVIKADVHASNGTIHWIDHVLLPPK